MENLRTTAQLHELSPQPSETEAQASGAEWRKKLTVSAAAMMLVLSGCNVGPIQSEDIHRPADSQSQAPNHNTQTAPPSVGSPEQTSPNVVFILTDDISNNMMPFMPNTQRLIGDRGARFTNYYDSNGLCCPSRSTILSGKYSHNTKVWTNNWPSGGFGIFHKTSEKSTIATWLQHAKQRAIATGFFGKYLNEYSRAPQAPKLVPFNFVPPGWDMFVSPVKGDPYTQGNVKLNVNGVVDEQVRSAADPDNYLTRILTRLSTNFLRDNAGTASFTEIAPYNAHFPFTPDPRDKDLFAGVSYPRVPSFDEKDMSDKPSFVADGASIDQQPAGYVDSIWRQRLQSAQSADRLVKAVVQTLKRLHELKNTYIVMVSDNGMVMGEHQLDRGKNNPYDEAVNLSDTFLVRGPGIKPGTVVKSMIGNVDLAPTFADMLNVKPPKGIDGKSLLPLMTGKAGSLRRYMLLERGATQSYAPLDSGLVEPAETAESVGEIATVPYEGVVSERYKLIRYGDKAHSFEFYDLKTDPYELNNKLPADKASLPNLSAKDWRIFARMNTAITKLKTCVGQACIR